MKKTLIGLMCSLLLLTGAAAVQDQTSSDSRPRSTLDSLRKELVSVRAELDTAEREMENRNKTLLDRQHQLEYQDPETVALREEIVGLERQLIAKRQQLQTRLALKPEIKDVESERKDLFQTLQRLRDTEAAIQREIAALERNQE